jgi:CheY-like chemotaxis protein
MGNAAYQMKRILFVDDDPLVLRIYQEALSRHGFYVEPARDGFEARKSLVAGKPDLMVLDLMMPRISGLEVLNFVRTQPELATLPIIVLTNAYVDEMARDAAAAGAKKVLFKVRCTPSILLRAIRELLEGKPASQDAAHLPPDSKVPAPVVASKGSTPVPPATAPPPATQAHPMVIPSAPAAAAAASDVEFHAKARAHFLEHAKETCAALRTVFQAFARAKNDTEREVQLLNLYRKVHFLVAGAGLAQCHTIARMASVFEAMLFELGERPALLNLSVVRTAALAVDFLEALFQQARNSSQDTPLSVRVLVVDDDPLANHVVVAALRAARFEPRSTEDPLIGLQWLRESTYDLILLDIEMPGMDGFELCKRLRQLPAYETTPVIYVTGHSDFESRARSALSGGDDLISKPVFPMELAVKAMTHLLGSQLAIKPGSS